MPEHKPYSLPDITAAIETAAGHLFSNGTLTDKTLAVQTLSEMPGLNLFATAVPWTITLPQGKPIVGFSETLFLAAKDIHAQLRTLAASLPSDTLVKIAIDAAQLPKPRQSIRSRTNEGSS